MEDITNLVKKEVEVYEDRIKGLEESEKKKDAEIAVLKLAILELSRQVESLQTQSKPAGGRP